MQKSLEEILIKTQTHSVLDPSILKSNYVGIDLSIHNPDLKAVDVSSSDELHRHIWSYMNVYKASVAYGGYLEQRGIYNRSDYFNKTNPLEERNIHLGLDLWLEAGSSIFSPLKGEIHSFNNNTNYGDYGPTIILKHKLNNFQFYTLYGHLSLDSISNLQVGKFISSGQKIAELGSSKVNGDYPPHLHFQLIKDMQDYKGDYPGVSNQLDLDFYKFNCPDPNLLIGLNHVN